MKRLFSSLVLALAGLAGAPPAVAQAPAFAKGADISWLTQMEASGRTFANSAGTPQDLLQILHDYDMNTIRLRVWVNPAGGWNGKNDVVAKAIRARNRGFRLLIDFHYSDSWADPGQQTKPAAWQSLTFAQLQQAVYNHTYDVLDTLKDQGIVPEWVQVGNETNDGMLWPDGKSSTNPQNFAALVNQGYDAVKAVNPSSKVIVHLANGFDNGLFRWAFDRLVANGARFDVIGLSLYPTAANWSALNTQCLSNMNDLVSRYPGKEVMLVETGMRADQPLVCQQMLLDLLSKVRAVPGNKGLGVLYWEPQAYNWQGYGLGAWDSNGRPTAAMDAFRNTQLATRPAASALALQAFPNPLASSQFALTYTLPQPATVAIGLYSLTGQRVLEILPAQPQASGPHTRQVAADVAPGLYLLKITSNGQPTVQKIVKY